MKTFTHIILLMGIIALFSSCATTHHPNEALIVGEWSPVRAEKYFTEEEEAQLKSMQSNSQGNASVKNDPKSPPAGPASSASPAGSSAQGEVREGTQNIDAALDRLIRAESRANIIIYPDKTAVKFYRERIVKATWKLRRNGTVFVARDLQNKEKYRIDILEVNETQMVVVENLPVGGIRITYTKGNTERIDQK